MIYLLHPSLPYYYLLFLPLLIFVLLSDLFFLDLVLMFGADEARFFDFVFVLIAVADFILVL